ncbi:MAG: acriflavin resistance protein [Spirochaetes bacterium GWF1_31_7]|nr:MAG: acriflavin resistance protein [Spirochaetes bacterium GWE1_32_154]OHD49006.1 MAG: acriflavin resistance protein [Spirochaetes bacterium GWE2_31_10]OHD49554.1 MAG: acriflavin resistance protein [Spirochaetes bacterium GWF1_31_7]HBD95898.1 AcrB/AcrD/AcrF family protein [Spirochaetia bacterium]HBI36724.1 AcrB/AcrD/AcrF family protein [Spirochaetia bacterium]
MSLSKTIVNRPTTIFILFLILVGIGFYASSDLAIDLYPDIDIPTLVLICDSKGSGPEEIEKRITRPLESVLGSVSGIKEITSTSSDGGCTLILSFNYGTNMSEAINNVRDKLDLVKRYLPEEASTPSIFKFDPSAIPILYIAMQGNRTPEELRKIAEDFVAPRLEQVNGVATASIDGGRARMIRVEISQNRLNAYNLTLSEISQMLMGQNVQLSAGSITDDNRNYLIQTSGEYQNIDQIKNTIVAYRGTKQIKLDDIAHVYDGFEKESSIVYLNGEPTVQIIVQKQSGSNSVQTADNVLKILPKIEKELPKGLSFKIVWNSTVSIKKSIEEVSNAAVSGAFLAILILFLFLRDIRSVIIIGVSIPISIIITLMFMYMFGLTLNMMTLAGLALGIGMLVDNSIVILENIFRYREKGAKLTSAAIIGSQEMINAIVASTLTTICVFIPMVIFKSQLEIVGELVAALSFTIVISLASSILVAVLLVPVLASHYLPIQSKLEKNLPKPLKKIDTFLENFFLSLDNLYKRGLTFVLNKRKMTLFVILASFIGSLFLIPVAGFEFMPKEDGDAVEINFELPVGTTLEMTKDVANQLKLLVEKDILGYTNIAIWAGLKSFMGFMGNAEPHKGRLQITLPEYEQRIDNETEIKTKLRKYFNLFPNVVFQFSSGGGMGGSSSPIDYIIKSNDLDKAWKVAENIKELIKTEVDGAAEPDVDMKSGLPQIEIFIDRDKAYSFGLNIYSIAKEIQANIDGIKASKFRDGGNEYDIIVILEETDKTSLPDLEKIFVVNRTGVRIPLSNIAHLEKTTGPVSIKRENQMRTVHVTAGLTKGSKLNVVVSQISKLIDQKIPKDEDVIITLGGDFQDLQELGKKVMIILIISIFLVFGVMASQFESFLDPFIIMFTLPLMLVGVSITYILTGEQFSIFTAVGMVVLSGVVVNNGIILVDYTNLLRKRGRSIKDACIEAGGNRLRPILMTTLTTILGLFPMAFSQGQGSSLSQPIAKTLLGGLTFSTLFTLFLIPVIYSIFNEFSDKRHAKKQIRIEKKLELKRQRILDLNANKAMIHQE